MKIVIVNRHVDDVLGGSEMQCDNISTELVKRGHEVTYVAPGAKSRKYNRIYKVRPADSNWRSIFYHVMEESPDIVYWRFNKNYFYRFARAINRQGIPIVFAVSHIDDTRKFNYLASPKVSLKQFAKAIKQALFNRINFEGYKFVNAVTYLNVDYLGSLPVSIEAHVPNCVVKDSESFYWPKPFIVWIANIKRAKRPEKFVELARELQGHGIDFLMVGSILSNLYVGLETEGDPPEFKYLGPQSVRQVNGILAASLMLVHTCEPEGFGNNFIQAWLAGKPTVSLGFDPGGYIEKYDLGGFSNDNFELFVSQVRTLMFNQDERVLAGLRAKTFAEENFSIEKTVDGVLDVFSSVLEKY